MEPWDDIKAFAARLWSRIDRRLRWLGCIPFGLIILWWNWNYISNLPFVPFLIETATREISIPRAAPGKFSVVVTKFVGDTNDDAQSLFVDDLRAIPAIRVVRIDEVIDGRDQGDIQSTNLKANREVHDILEKTAADVLVWAEVFHVSGQTLVRPHFENGMVSDADIVGSRVALDHLDYPQVTELEFRRALTLAIVTHLARFARETADAGQSLRQLRALIAGVESILDNEKAHLTPNGLALVYQSLAEATFAEGQLEGNFAKAATEIRRWVTGARTQWTFSNYPDLRALLDELDGLTALTVGCETDDDSNKPQDLAIAYARFSDLMAYDIAQGEATAYVSDNGNEGLAYECLGRLSAGMANDGLSWQVHALLIAENIFVTDQKYISQNLSMSGKKDFLILRNHDLFNLATAQSLLGLKTGDAAFYRHSISAFKEVASDTPKNSFPLEWAKTMDGLGLAYYRLGSLTNTVGDYRLGLQAESGVSSVLSRVGAVQAWARAIGNLGGLQQALANCQGDPELLSDAYATFQSSEEEFRAERDDEDAQMAHTAREQAKSLHKQNCSL